MRINDRNLTGATPAESGRAQEAQKPNRNQGVQTETPTTDKAGDRVELSSTLEALSRAISAFGAERSNRVQLHAVQYQRGTFHPDSEATARGIVSEALLAGG